MPFLPYPQVDKLDRNYLIEKFHQWLQEDIPERDITSEIFYDSNHISVAYLENEEDCVFAGKQLVEILPELTASDVNLEFYFDDGDTVPKKSKIFQIEAPTKFILNVERTLLNILQRLSGIATNTKKYVEIARPYGVRVLDTRKTTPGLRLLEKYAVRCGGGWNHRLNLSEAILIKDNHIAAAESITIAVQAIRSIYPNKFIEVEIESILQIPEVNLLKVDGVLLDNLTPAEVAQCVKKLRAENPLIFIEASGGINLSNIEEYAKTGVDAISIGALTHSAPSIKMHLEFKI